MTSAVPVPRPRRLAVVSDAVSPWNTGGKEQRHHELLTRLARDGWRVDVYTMKWWQGPDVIERDGLRFHAICRHRPLYAGNRRSIVQAVAFALACVKLLWRRFDVVEVDAIPFLPLFPMRVVATVRRRPMVVTWYEFWGRRYWTDYLGPLGHLAATIEALSLRVPDRIIAASGETGRRLHDEYPSLQGVAVVPPGVRLESSLAERSPSPTVELITVGRLLAHKNVDRAIEATALLNERGRAARLTVVGEGPELEALQTLVARRSWEGCVRFVPFQADQRDMHDLVAASTVLLFPSAREGFGMVALEAMALGVPVVTSDHPDNLARHLVTDGVSGVVCAVEPAALADATERVLDDLGPMSRAAREAASDYDWDELARRAAVAYSL